MSIVAQLPHDLALNWGHNQVAWKLGADRRCVSGCGFLAFMNNADGRPQHKVCAELELLRAHGPDGAWRLAAAGYPPKGSTTTSDGGRPGSR